MASINKYNIHTYKDILETLKTIEIEDNRLRRQKSLYVISGALLGLYVIAIFFFIGFSKISPIELFTSFGAYISLGPVFGFIYYSTQGDLISQRKEQFWDSLINHFSSNNIVPFTNESLSEDELRKVLMEKINEKINEALKYEQ